LLTIPNPKVKNYLAKITSFGLVTIMLALAPGLLSAQDATTNASAQTTPKKTKKHATNLVFHGKISAVDVGAGTFTLRTLTLNVTSATRIKNATNGEPATLSDLSVGENVSGSYLRGTNGQLTARSIYIGVRTGKPQKKATPSATGSGTNSVSN
jgi:Domain of unknown function (DUF5666)